MYCPLSDTAGDGGQAEGSRSESGPVSSFKFAHLSVALTFPVILIEKYQGDVINLIIPHLLFSLISIFSLALAS
jgi:hypothetical protein